MPVSLKTTGRAMPIPGAAEKLRSKVPVASVLRTAEWAQMPLALRERAQFSAGVESARVMSSVQSKLDAAISLQRETLATGERAYVDRSSFIGDLRKLAIEEGLGSRGEGSPNNLRDITSRARIGLIYDTQIQQAEGYAKWTLDQSMLDDFPAQELYRAEPRLRPRDWPSRWIAAGGTLSEGRMIALKNDPIWIRINRFGVPWAPFDFNSGMDLRDIDSKEAVRLRLLEPGQPVVPVTAAFNDRLEASVRDIDPAFRDVLKSLFGDQIDVDGDVAKWKVGIDDYEVQQAFVRENAQAGYAGAQAGIRELRDLSASVRSDPSLSRIVDERWPVEISAVISGRKPLFHESIGEGNASLMVAELRKRLPSSVEVRAADGEVFVYRPDQWRVPFEQIRVLGDSGKALGYGADMFSDATASVSILDGDNQVVSVFHAPPEKAAIYAAARAKDWADATGARYSYRVEGLP